MTTASLRGAKEEKYGVKWEAHTLLGGKCAECQEAFGVLSIRRHCRKCGHIVCSKCQNPEKVVVPGSANPKTVCKSCARVEEPARENPGGEADKPTAKATVATGQPCTLCGEELGEEVIVIDDDSSPLKGQIHVECFVCCIDGQAIDGAFAESNGKLFCEEHYKEFMCASCGGCGNKIVEGAVVQALGQQWHLECFACDWCNQPLGGDGDSQFGFHQHDGAVYCEKCYQERFCKKCHECGFPVSNGLQAMGVTYHRECFVCTECRQPFADMEECTFAVVDGSPFCVKCSEAVGGLTAQERSALQTVPSSAIPAAADRKSSKGISPEEYGGCLSKGIAEALKELEGAEISLQGAAPGRRAFHEKRQWTLQADAQGPNSFEFASLAPGVFEAIRQQAFGIKPEEYHSSLCLRTLTGGKTGEGKSGMLFYFSWDYRFIIKTISHAEAHFFEQCLRDYQKHLSVQPRNGNCTASLMPRYLDVFTAKFQGLPAMNFIVMSNVFPPRAPMKEQYDVKGVLGKQRFVSEEEIAKGVKVLKDRNFAQRSNLKVGQSLKVNLEAQLRRDCAFLMGHDRMDYSLLLGVADASSVKDPGSVWPVVESAGLLAKDEAGKEIYFMGIIDVLQEYNWRKALESNLKTAGFRAMHMAKKRASLRNADNAVSAASPSHYAARFVDFVMSKLD